MAELSSPNQTDRAGRDDPQHVDPVAEATAQAAAGATTDVHADDDGGIYDGAEPDPDLAQE